MLEYLILVDKHLSRKYFCILKKYLGDEEPKTVELVTKDGKSTTKLNITYDYGYL